MIKKVSPKDIYTTIKSSKKSDNLKTFHNVPFIDDFTFQKAGSFELFLQQLAVEWVDWTIANEDVLTFGQFYIRKKVARTTFQGWTARNENLLKAQEFVRLILGVRRELGGLHKKLDTQMVVKSMSLYDEEWKTLETWRATMATNIVGAGGGVTVVEVQRFSDTDVEVDKK